MQGHIKVSWASDIECIWWQVNARGIHVIVLRPKKKDSCVQVSEVKKIRVGRSKNIFILDFFFY